MRVAMTLFLRVMPDVRAYFSRRNAYDEADF
jgi:hypothetical protein